MNTSIFTYGIMATKVTWSSDLIEAFAAACKEQLTLSVLQDIERRIRAGTGSSYTTTLNHAKCQGCSNANNWISHYNFKKESGDTLGEIVDALLKDTFTGLLVGTAERAAAVYERIKAKLKQKNDPIYAEDKRSILNGILKESFIFEIEQQALQKFAPEFTGLQLRIARPYMLSQWREKHYERSNDAFLLALPSAYQGTLDDLKSDTIRDLMVHGVGVQDFYIGEMQKHVYDEIELLEMRGKFEEMSQLRSSRTDHICWLTLSDLDRCENRGLIYLFNRMLSLPYELNKKAKLALQVQASFMLSYFSSKGAFLKKHMDNGYKKSDENGIKVTCIYFPNALNRQTSDGGCLRIFQRQSQSVQETPDYNLAKISATPFRDILPKGDRLVIFKTREIPYEVLPNYCKQFAVILTLPGPIGPGDSPE